MRQDRSRKGFIDCAIQCLIQRFLPAFSQIFTNTVEDDDRVVERVTDNREDSSHNRERHFEMHDLEERERRENIVAGGDQRGKRESPLESDHEIDLGHKERQKHRIHRRHHDAGGVRQARRCRRPAIVS